LSTGSRPSGGSPETRPSAYTKAGEAARPCPLGGGRSRGAFGEAGLVGLCDSGRCFPDRLRLMLYTVPPDL
jgi:hypothetical protein